MIPVADYLRLRYRTGGRTRPEVDCWGLYRLIVGEQLGVWLGEHAGVEAPLVIARTASREAAGGEWCPVAPGSERLGDAVLMSGVVGAGRQSHVAPIHVGCVLAPGRMLDIEGDGGVRLRSYRTVGAHPARPEVANRVVGLYRPLALADRVAA